jgi:hypothetical protein
MVVGSMVLFSKTGAAKETTARTRVIDMMARGLKDIILWLGRLLSLLGLFVEDVVIDIRA